jgi:hypothetical protein
MAIGDQNDFTKRIKSTLPQAWFGDASTPILNGVLAGYSWLGALMYSDYTYSALQTRIKTATDDFLDLISQDFFGTTLPRNQGESDASFRNRIIVNLIRIRATRQGIINVLVDLTGRTPLIFEPQRPMDTGGYSIGGAGYGVAGGWGSVQLTCQAFCIAYRPNQTGIPSVAGYGVSTGAYSTASQASWANISQVLVQVQDAQIYAAIDNVKTAGTIIWTQIQS